MFYVLRVYIRRLNKPREVGVWVWLVAPSDHPDEHINHRINAVPLHCNAHVTLYVWTRNSNSCENKTFIHHTVTS